MMLDSPTKKPTKTADNQGQVLWRGTHWLLFKPGADVRSLPRVQSLPDKSSLDELATDLQKDTALRSGLKKALRALDNNLSSTDDADSEQRTSSKEGDILEIILYIVDSLKNGQLLWLPPDAIDTPQSDGSDATKTSERKAETDDLNKPAAPSKAKPKKILKRKTTVSDNSGPQTPSQLVKSLSEKAADEAPKAAQKPAKTSGQAKRAPQTGKPAKPSNPGNKSLIELFTNADAITGEPVSRWLAFTGAIPGDGSAVVDGTVLAQAATKVIRKPGKLGNGKVSPRNAKLLSQHSPISIISGEKVLPQIDFELPGPIPLLWQRVYRSSHSKDLGLGVGWTSTLLARLDLRENEIIYCDGEGREIPFERLPTGKSCCNSVEQLTLYCDDATVYRIIDTDHTILTFGGSGKRRRLYEITDRDGHAIKLFYSANDRLIQILDSTGRRLKLDYNITDQLRRIYLCNDKGDISDNPLVEYGYNNDREMVKATDAMGNSQAYEYRYHLITKHTTKDGFSYHFEWDEYTIKGKCTRTWGDGDIYSYRFKYDEVNKITRSTDARGNTSEFHYNELGLITTHIDPEGGVSHYTYNEDGLVLSVRSPIGTTAHYSYDACNRLTQHVNSDGGVSEFEYDEAGNLSKFIDPLQQTWERHYDQRGRITSLIDPEGQVTQFSYEDNTKDSCRSCTVTNALGHTEQFEWNSKGNLLAHTDALEKKSQYSHDDLGRVTKILEGQDRSTHFSYDRCNNITQIIHPNGASVQMLYSPNGNLTQYVDAIGRTTRYKYDGLNHLVERCDPEGRRVFYEYDKQRNLTAVINENGERHERLHDKNGRLIQEIGFDGRIQKYNYNAAGHIVRHLDGANRVTSFKRDPLGRVLQKRTSTGEITQYEYDAQGQLVKAYNSHCVVHFRYNSRGQLVGEMQNDHRIQYVFNAGGQKTKIVLPDGKTIGYEYDQHGLLSRVSYDGKVLCTVEHDHHGRETRRVTGKISSHFDYDPMGRLIHQRTMKGKSAVWERQYRYDKTGNLRQIDDLNSGKVRFHFDNLDRLNRAEGAINETFTFDPAGNLLDSQYPEPQGFVQGNRLRVFQNFRFEYDDVGNLVRQFQGRLETRFYYNVANQLVRAYRNGQTTEYTYDPLGRRCKKADAMNETDYLWDGDILLHESRNKRQSNALSITYIHEPGGLNPICQIRNGEVFFYLSDHTGMPHLMTNVNGEIVWKAQYKSHGGVSQMDIEFIENPLRFPGQYHDTETGLHHSRFRYYHPVTGRYIHQHPCGLKGGINPYEYAPNPLSWVNPLGTHNKEVFAHRDYRNTAEPFIKIPRVGVRLPDKSADETSNELAAQPLPYREIKP